MMRCDAGISQDEMAQFILGRTGTSEDIQELESGKQSIPFVSYLKWFYVCTTNLRAKELNLNSEPVHSKRLDVNIMLAKYSHGFMVIAICPLYSLIGSIL